MEKKEVIPDNVAPKSDFLRWSRIPIETLSTNSETDLWRHEKLKSVDGFRHSLLEFSVKILKQDETSQEVKVKLNESRQLKFYLVKQLKENSTDYSAEKNLKEDSKFNEILKVLFFKTI